ncbi:hypothetical protein BCT58_13620 [Vibrio lentus]|nr:hypothetical protein BCT58_13620 [Vibrio lentus]
MFIVVLFIQAVESHRAFKPVISIGLAGCTPSMRHYLIQLLVEQLLTGEAIDWWNIDSLVDH